MISAPCRPEKHSSSVISFPCENKLLPGEQNEKYLKPTVHIAAMTDRDLLSSIPTEILLAADTNQYHMYSHGSHGVSRP